MDKCIQFKELTQDEQLKVLSMVRQTGVFPLLFEQYDPATAGADLQWFLDQTTEHFVHMNRLTGGKYGATVLDV